VAILISLTTATNQPTDSQHNKSDFERGVKKE
jgi:hypothetical protein